MNGVPRAPENGWVLLDNGELKVTDRILGTWLHLRTHHLWRIIMAVDLVLGEDHLPQSTRACRGRAGRRYAHVWGYVVGIVLLVASLALNWWLVF